MSGLKFQIWGKNKEFSEKKKTAAVVKVSNLFLLLCCFFYLLQFRTGHVPLAVSLPLHTDSGDVACCFGESDWSSFLLLISWSVLKFDTIIPSLPLQKKAIVTRGSTEGSLVIRRYRIASGV